MNKQPFRLGPGGTGVLGAGTGDLYMEVVLGVGTGDLYMEMFYSEQTTIWVGNWGGLGY